MLAKLWYVFVGVVIFLLTFWVDSCLTAVFGHPIGFVAFSGWKQRDIYMLGFGLIGFLGYAYLVWGTSAGGSKTRMHRSYWGGRVEESNARKRAIQQIKKPKRNSVALYVGISPERVYKKLVMLLTSLSLQRSLGNRVDEDLLVSFRNAVTAIKPTLRSGYQQRRDRKRLYLPDVQRGTAVCGAPGSGKTYSIIDPLLRSAVEQGHPIVLYDFKYPDQASLLVPFALLHGYKVNIFAPGFDESDVCNPLYFLLHVLDAETARQTGTVMNKNFNLGDAKGDKFFDTAADQLTEAAFMVTRALRECDLLSCQAFISLPNLVPRIKAWTKRSSEQDLALLLLGEKLNDILNLFKCILHDSETCLEFNYLVEYSDGSKVVFNLLDELIAFMNFYRKDFETAREEMRNNSSNELNKRILELSVTEQIILSVSKNRNSYRFLQNKLPSVVKGEDGELTAVQATRDALYALLKQFQRMYDNSQFYYERLCQVARQVASEVEGKEESLGFANFTENFTESSMRELLSYLLDTVTYFINVHPDYNPGVGVLRTRELKPWIRSGFSQLISTERSERTLSSIISVTNNNLTRFVKPNIARHFVGQSTVPMYLEGKQLLVFGLDRERRDTVGPLMATVLHLLVNYNLTFKKDGQRRKYPLVVSLDELPTIYLPALTQWLNENRSDGFCGVIGFQNVNQIQQAYGEKIAKAILTGCNAKFIFNPGEPESAELFSRMLGEESYDTKQRSRSSGKGGSSVSVSDQEKGRKLFEPAQFLRLPQGSCIFVSPGYSNKKESNVPMFRAVNVPREECELAESLLPLWEHFRTARIKAVGGDQLQDDRLHLDRRQTFIEHLFVEVVDPAQASNAADD